MSNLEDIGYVHILLRSHTAIKMNSTKPWQAQILNHKAGWPRFNAVYCLHVPYMGKQLRLQRTTCFCAVTTVSYYYFYDEETNIIHWSGIIREYYESEDAWKKEREEHEASDPKLTSDAIKRTIRDDHNVAISSKTLGAVSQAKELQLSRDRKDPWDIASKIS